MDATSGQTYSPSGGKVVHHIMEVVEDQLDIPLILFQQDMDNMEVEEVLDLMGNKLVAMVEME